MSDCACYFVPGCMTVCREHYPVFEEVMRAGGADDECLAALRTGDHLGFRRGVKRALKGRNV